MSARRSHTSAASSIPCLMISNGIASARTRVASARFRYCFALSSTFDTVSPLALHRPHRRSPRDRRSVPAQGLPGSRDGAACRWPWAASHRGRQPGEHGPSGRIGRQRCPSRRAARRSGDTHRRKRPRSFGQPGRAPRGNAIAMQPGPFQPAAEPDGQQVVAWPIHGATGGAASLGRRGHRVAVQPFSNAATEGKSFRRRPVELAVVFGNG